MTGPPGPRRSGPAPPSVRAHSVPGRTRSAGSRWISTSAPPSRVAIASWILCAVAALILLLSDFYGYAGVVFAVALAAAINLR